MIKKYLSLTFILIVVYACATVQSPTGGEKDEKAPILYESSPKDQSTNFKGNEIKLFFNEWMKLEQINKELIITPRADIEYEAALKKQELTIELKQPLEDSTTYTFNFRKALSDITEGNLWENPVLAFSTGPYLDSLKVEGTITKLMTQEPGKGYLVGLYDAKSDTANLREGKPVYFTTTDEKGNFRMQNLKAGKYLLYTFEDKNDNLINNPQAESYGFHSDTLTLFDSIPPIAISTYQRNEDTLKLKKFSPVGKDFIVQYNKGLSSYEIINPKNPDQHIYTNGVEASQYLKIYKENFPNLEYETDSVQLFITVKDSLSQSRTDTVFFKIRESRITNDKIKIENKPNGKTISGQQQFTYNLSKPIYTINYDSIQLRIDTIPIKTFNKEELHFNFNRKEVRLTTIIQETEINQLIDSLKLVSDSIQNYNDSIQNQNDSTDSNIERNSKNGMPNRDTGQLTRNDNKPTTENASVPRGNTTSGTSNYTLQLYTGRGAFIGIESDSTDQSTTSIQFKKAEDYGTIKGEIKNLESDYIVQLLTEKYELKDTVINSSKFQFNYVESGSYRLRLIEDKNGNQKWDAGNPLTLTPAENIYYLEEVITVKANWEVIDKNFDFSVDKTVNEGEENEDL
ncbi:hypothetical protein MATR_00050 [Marivirga tractuosa]|uniref:SbsA Ig-like domain-containing protein n=1 Tax=Marivirga tractuosa (strain ATCC 23168 / DSM 4126 / NBRC 15989 / NCIMB 1408 / VKM B-1430 / H-43) TaxID=643867 RepID=E4TM95_MARTH|nr:Ig-like domain-containing domain [Marivirga tractuosa]ADR22354.1 hypothetical protein Ftrac_2376 [Marivirga tractuosa DSM 4126]BDD13180.1 hypothetical protein MATR_00050 [Marivirga tractuosa]